MKVAGVLMLVLLVAGCGAHASTSAPRPHATASASPSGVPANVGSRGLRVGQTRHGNDIDTTMLEVQQHVRAPSYAKPDQAGDVWVTAKVRACAHAAAPQGIQADANDFIVTDTDGGQYSPSGTSYDAWPPRPQYPRGSSLLPGSCVSGWMAFEVPSSVKLATIDVGDHLDSGYVLAAEWRL